MGKDMPRSFPRLATPTPHVKVVLYPEHSFPISTHCPQYGRRRSHFIWRFLHAKQSSVAPVAGALLLRFLGAAAAAALLVVVVDVVVVMGVISTFLTSAGWVVGETAMLGSIKDVMLLQYSTVLHLQDVDRVSRCLRRMDRTTRGNTQWSIEGASRWVSIISSTASTGKGRELGPSLIRSGP